MNFKAVLVLPKTASSAQTHEIMSFIRVVWSTLYVGSQKSIFCTTDIWSKKFTQSFFLTENTRGRLIKRTIKRSQSVMGMLTCTGGYSKQVENYRAKNIQQV